MRISLIAPDILVDAIEDAQRIHGLSISEVARASDLSPATVRKVIGQARVSDTSLYKIMSGLQLRGRAVEEVGEEIQKAIKYPFEDWELEDVPENDVSSLTAARNLAAEFPASDETINVGVSSNNLLTFTPTPIDANDAPMLELFRAQMFAEDGPLVVLRRLYNRVSGRLANTPQADAFRPHLDRYHQELSKPLDEINFAYIYVHGVQIAAAQRHASAQIESGEWEDYSHPEAAAHDALEDYHSQLMMHSSARELVAKAHVWQRSDAQLQKDQRLNGEFVAALGAAQGENAVMEPRDIEILAPIVEGIPNDEHRKRTQLLGYCMVGSVATTVVFGSAFALLGLTAAGVASGVAAGISARVFWKVLDQTKAYKKFTKDAAEGVDQILGYEEEVPATMQEQIELLRRTQKSTEENHALLVELAANNPFMVAAEKQLERIGPQKPSKSKLSSPNGSYPLEQIYLDAAQRFGGRVQLVVSNVVYLGAIECTANQASNVTRFLSRQFTELLARVPEDGVLELEISYYLLEADLGRQAVGVRTEAPRAIASTTLRDAETGQTLIETNLVPSGVEGGHLEHSYVGYAIGTVNYTIV